MIRGEESAQVDPERGAHGGHSKRASTLKFHSGQFAAIMGSSGSGKSTLLGLLAGLDTPTSGDVVVNGVAISYLPEDKLAQVRGRSIGFVFQSYQLIPTLTALENVLLPYELNSDAEMTGRWAAAGAAVAGERGAGGPDGSLPGAAFGRGAAARGAGAGVCAAAADCAGG